MEKKIIKKMGGVQDGGLDGGCISCCSRTQDSKEDIERLGTNSKPLDGSLPLGRCPGCGGSPEMQGTL